MKIVIDNLSDLAELRNYLDDYSKYTIKANEGAVKKFIYRTSNYSAHFEMSMYLGDSEFYKKGLETINKNRKEDLQMIKDGGASMMGMSFEIDNSIDNDYFNVIFEDR